MSTLSPFRYIQLARYIVQNLLERSPRLSKGKGKATTPPYRLAFATAAAESRRPANDPPPSVLGRNASGESAEPSESSESNGSSGSAGPSNYRIPELRPDPDEPPEPTEIYRLMNDERLLVPGAVKPPKEVVVLCHGLYGFSTATPIPLFPSLKLHYWASVLDVLRDKMGANVLVVGVKGTGSVKERAEQMHAFLSANLPKGSGVNFVAHSMGGLDVRYLISNIKPTSYTPVSLTTIGTPHRGSPFMDWCAANIGVGSVPVAGAAMAAAAMAASKEGSDPKTGLPFSLKTPLLTAEQAVKDAGGVAGFSSALSRYLLGIFDSPAYSNLTISFLRDEFNPDTPDSPNVKYTSVAGRVPKLSIFHPLWFPKLVLDAAAEKGYPEPGGKTGEEYEGNDGLVSVSSAKWGEFLGVVDDTHHWDLRGEGGIWPNGVATGTKKETEQAKASEGKKGEEELVMPGGWDWDQGYEEQLGLGDKLLKTASSMADKATSAIPGMSTSTPTPEQDKRKSTKKGENGDKGDSSWDKAQLGQVLDWVTDLLPGGKSTDVGKKQLEEVRREGGKKDKEREAARQAKKKKEFDLARFYGGLMIKLREDGF